MLALRKRRIWLGPRRFTLMGYLLGDGGYRQHNCLVYKSIGGRTTFLPNIQGFAGFSFWHTLVYRDGTGSKRAGAALIRCQKKPGCFHPGATTYIASAKG